MDLLQPVRGTADLLPEDKARHNHVISVALDVARRAGFQDMATPVFEFTDVFSRPLGASSDVVSKEYPQRVDVRIFGHLFNTNSLKCRNAFWAH